MNRRDFFGALGSSLATSLVPAVHRSVGSLWLAGRAQPLRLIERWSWAMGQPVHLQLFASSDDHGYEAAAAALSELRRVESRLSLFDDSSDLVELNRRAGRSGLRVGSDLEAVLRAAVRFRDESGGAFNPAVEPLMRAWGFHAPRSSEPTRVELAEARAAVMAAKISFEDERIRLPSSDTQLDLGGIGVGYGLDRAMAVLRQAGIEHAFLDVSGDCLALGAPPGTTGWLVQIAAPTGKTPVGSVRIRNQALATSANTRSVVRYHRAVRGHVMNPRTGWPADALTQVTVLARTGIEADALSTAMLVSGTAVSGVVRHWNV
jgi:FAD:protein FMN transferase